MKKITKKTRTKVRREASERRKNIVGNFRGSEDIFWTKVVKGFEKFCKSPFK